MDLNLLKNTIQKYIASDEIERAIGLILNLIDEYENIIPNNDFIEFKNVIITLSSNLYCLNKKRDSNIIDNTSFKIEKNQIVFGFANTISQLPNFTAFDNFLNNYSTYDILEKFNIEMLKPNWQNAEKRVDFSDIFTGNWKNCYFFNGKWFVEYFTILNKNQYFVTVNTKNGLINYHAFNLELLKIEQNYIHLLKHSVNKYDSKIFENVLFIIDDSRFIGVNNEPNYQYIKVH